ncbi:MAG TPA: hypothetical protein VKT49_21445 [Bryobacteraceae bacterium]|nr:hypothetical protein [Bryobacteraceae bacterium]
MRFRHSVICGSAALGSLMLCCLTAAAQNSKASPSLSGYWELHFDSRNVPPASLKPEVAAEDPAIQHKKDMTELRWCHFMGVPYSMESTPIDILQNQNGKEIIITSSLRSPARHIYTDGRSHVNPDVFDPVSNGHSIGHWEGDTLIVDTVGFSEEGLTRIPGGGRRTTTSHLVERYRLLDGGKLLSVTFTWEDPKIFARPHTYEFRYYRSPKGMEAREFDCDANNEERAQFLLEAPGR